MSSLAVSSRASRSSRGIARERLLVGFLLLVSAIVLGSRLLREEPERPLTLAERYAADDRVGYLLADCAFTQLYEVDTSNMIPILVEKLATGQRDPIKRARAELAEIGEPAVDALRRRFEQSYRARFEHGILENIIGACNLMEGPYGLDIIREGARHEKETVRLVSIDGLEIHGGPEDYDLVALSVEVASSDTTRAEVCQALLNLDKERFARQLCDWFESGTHKKVWRHLAPLICDVEDPETIRRFREFANPGNPQLEPFLLAPAAVNGDEEALTKLRTWLEDPLISVRQMSMEALARAGRPLEARTVFQGDPSKDMRMFAAEFLSKGLDEVPELRDDLFAGLSDQHDDVASACLQLLCNHGDERAISQAISMLAIDGKPRETAITALRETLQRDPQVVKRARETLVLIANDAIGGGSSRALNVLQALAQVPGRETAEYLLELGDLLTGTMKGWPPHRWLTHQCFNAGPEAVDVMMERLVGETDPFRRLDLLHAISQERSQRVRELLAALVQDDTLDPHERVYLARRTIHLGPGTEVAPMLKRIYIGTSDPVLRPALHCLLWAWYG